MEEDIIKADWKGDTTIFKNFESKEEAEKLKNRLKESGWENVKIEKMELESPTQVSREDFLKFVEENKEELKGKLCVI